MQELDAIPLGVDLGNARTFQKIVGTDTITATVAQQQLYRADLLVLYMIRDAYPTRPVYFSRTAGGYGQELGLQSHLLTTGLARKLVTTPPTPSNDVVMMPGEGWVDLTRSTELWQNVFEGPKALIRARRLGRHAESRHPGSVHDHRARARRRAGASGQDASGQSILAQTKQVASAMRSTRDFGLDRPQAGVDARPTRRSRA